MRRFSFDYDRVAILAHDHFPEHAKTAVGLLRYGPYEVVGILDRARAGDRVTDHATDLPDAPIVGSFDAIEDEPDALMIGIAPAGGAFDESWRSDVDAALAAGCDVVSGLHDPLGEDGELASLAETHDAEIYDVREPPEDIPLSSGAAAEADAHVVLTVGTDAGVGKMTTTLELVDAARERGVDAGFIPTGQTGIMIAGRGVAIDRVYADFVSGAIEQMILDAAETHDVLFVEGQGSIVHPAYSADSCGILHGAMADALVLVHNTSRDTIRGFEDVTIPSPEAYVDLYESVAEPVSPSPIRAGALNTSGIENDREARRACKAFSSAIDAPATDVIRFDPEEIVDVLLPRAGGQA